MLFWKITTFTGNKFEVLLALGVRVGLRLGFKWLKWLGFGQELVITVRDKVRVFTDMN